MHPLTHAHISTLSPLSTSLSLFSTLLQESHHEEETAATDESEEGKLVDKEHRLPTLTTVRVPDGVDAKAVQAHLMDQYNIEIGAGLGALAGKVWRIGLMGYNSNRTTVLTLVSALRKALAACGFEPKA